MSEKSRVLKTISVNNSNKNENENERRNKKIGRDFDEAMKRNPIGITQCLMGATHERNLADEACQDGKYKKAVKHYLEAMEKLDEGFGEESYQHVESIIGLCEAYIGLKDWKSVEKFAFRLIKIAADYECYETVQTAKELLEIGKNKGATTKNEVEMKEVKIDEEKTDENKPTNCASCNALNAKFRCSSCKSVNYCSKECQASDWRTHKSQCSANKAQSSVVKDPSKPVCGLCGFEGSRTIKIIKTDCCNNWICQDQQNYEISSFKLNSCQRNHQRYTLCSTHCEEKHQGKFTDCHVCQPSYRCFHADSEEERAWKKFTYKHFYFENVGDKERKRNRELKRDGTKAFMVQIPFGGR